jgi:hypothetical protein
MTYQWKPQEIDLKTNIPFSCGPAASYLVIEEDGKVIASGTFKGQEAIDRAWRDGYHEPGRPETKGAWPIEEKAEEPKEAEEPAKEIKKSIYDMNRGELETYASKWPEYDAKAPKNKEILREEVEYLDSLEGE